MIAQPALHIKRYRDGAARRGAERNYRWLADLGGPLRLPQLLIAEGQQLGFEHVTGRHAEPGDLVTLAGHLGEVHAAAHAAELHRARMDRPYRTASGHQIPGFLGRRLAAVTRKLDAGLVPDPAFSIKQAECLLRGACGEPAAFYKDANPRNFLVTRAGPVAVDFDDLTLAPFGYDLAKLVVTLAMTYGAFPAGQITAAIDSYNAASHHWLGPRALTLARLMTWAEVHHILTSGYRGRSGYRHSWHDLRISPAVTGGSRWP
jgi:Ser/Thr protein kinase RdoA (MazF antagonist)